MGKLRKSAWLALLISLMLLAAACGDGGGGGGDDGGGDDEAAACDPSTLTPLEPAEDTQATAAGSFAIAQAKPTVTIGAFGDRTGDNSNIVVPAHEAMALAVKQANERGDLPVNLVLKALDNRNGAAETAPAIAQQFIGDPSVVAVLGGGFSGETAATGGLYSEAGLLLLSQSATRPDLTQLGFRTFFRGLANDNVQGSGIMDVFEHLGCETVGIVDDKSPYGAGLGNVARESAGDAGMEIVVDESIEPTTDYTALVDSVLAAEPDALFYSGYGAQFQLVARQLRERGYEGVIASGDGSKETDIGQKIGPQLAENVLLTCACPDINLSPDEDAREFVRTFREEYNHPPGTYAAEGWDVANATIEVIRQCGEGGPGGVTRQCVVERMRESNYDGITKTMEFDEDGEVRTGTISLFVIRDGAVREVGPTDQL